MEPLTLSIFTLPIFLFLSILVPQFFGSKSF
jgi:hypothetical protein